MSTTRAPDPIRVFMVDDHPLVREWISALLRLEPDMEVCGEAGEQTPASWQALLAAHPDVLVVDLSLKRGSGLELIKAARAGLPAVRCLVLSMHEEMADIERAVRAGAMGYVMKRGSTGQIVEAIRRVHAGQFYADSEVQSYLAGRLLGDPGAPDPRGENELSDRELEVFRRLGTGHSVKRIAEELGVNVKTVQTYCSRIKSKLGLEEGGALLRAAILAAGENGSDDSA